MQVQTDIGRPITDIVSKLKYDTLAEDVRKVLETLQSKTIEVENRDNQWFQMRIMPYRTINNVIDGVVVTFLSINAQKQAEEKVKQLNEAMQKVYTHLTLMMEVVHEPLLILNKNLHIIAANQPFYRTFKFNAEQTINHSIYNLWGKHTSINQLQQLLEEKLKDTGHFRGFNLEYRFEEQQPQKLLLNAQLINYNGLNTQQILLTVNLLSEKENSYDQT